MEEREIKFAGIDSWNRPVFFSGTKKEYMDFYGSVDTLFDYGTPEDEIIDNLNIDELVYFGTCFDCEPMGTKPSWKLKIVK